jgi:hypothetical protein
MFQALNADWAEALDLHGAGRVNTRLGRDVGLTGVCALLHARGHMDCFSGRVVPESVEPCDRVHHHLTGIYADPYFHGRGFVIRVFPRLIMDEINHGKSRATRADRVVLGAVRGTKKSHDSVAGDLGDSASVALHGLAHQADRLSKNLLSHFGIQSRDEVE